MARPRSVGLTDNELAIMKILWSKAPLSIAELLESLERKPKPAYTSLLTVMKAMEEKGYIRHEKDSKAHIYFPVLKQSDYRRFAIKRLVANLFEGSATELAVNLLKEEKLSLEDKKEIQNILEQL